jgi:hypothetical protein
MYLIPIREVHDETATQGQSDNTEPARTEPGSHDAAVPSASGVNAADKSRLQRPRGIARVPTHTVGSASERRAYVRAKLTLPLSVRTIAGRPETNLAALSTHDMSSSGIFFLCPRRIEPGTSIEMEVTLVDNTGRGTVKMRTQACVVRAQDTTKSGWHGLAASFDDITFIRDEPFSAA